MKQLLKRKPALKDDQAGKRSRTGGAFMWLVLIVWVIMFELIRTAFKLGGNPIIMFLIMFSLFFFLLFGLRVGLVRTQTWWRNFRPGLVRFLARLIYGRRR